jgi:hypothetical protein
VYGDRPVVVNMMTATDAVEAVWTPMRDWMLAHWIGIAPSTLVRSGEHPAPDSSAPDARARSPGSFIGCVRASRYKKNARSISSGVDEAFPRPYS